jgi:hypothetical protein
MRLLSFLIISIALTIGCDEDSVSSSDAFEVETNETQVITLTAQTNFITENTNGIINVTASDTASNVYCDIKKKVRSKISESDAQSHLSDINITFEQNNTNVRIEVDHPISNDRDYETHLDIVLPDNFNHDLSLGNGTVSVNSTTKMLVIGLGNGTVSADVLLVDTCSASVSLGNGELNFTIPDNINAMLVASVGNGLISNNGLNFQNQQITSRQFSGTLGSGVGNINLSVGNGNIAMNKK